MDSNGLIAVARLWLRTGTVFIDGAFENIAAIDPQFQPLTSNHTTAHGGVIYCDRSTHPLFIGAANCILQQGHRLV